MEASTMGKKSQQHAGVRASVAAACVAVAMAAGLPAQAAEVTLTGWAFGSGGKVSGNRYAGSAGGFGGSLSGAGAMDSKSFITYCVELEESFGFSSTPMSGYNVVAGNTYFGAEKSASLARLVSFVDANPTAVDTAFESTALQLAVWNIVYDKDWNLAEGAFKDSSGFSSYATTLLAGAAKVSAPSFTVYALERKGTQDFLLAARVPTPERFDRAVAEPGSAALAVLSLAGLVVFSARRRVGAARP
jgi:hypothetical protein